MKRRKYIAIILFIPIVVALIIFVNSRRKLNETAQVATLETARDQTPSLKTIAVRPIRLSQALSSRQKRSSSAENDFVIPDEVPLSCRKVGIIKEIIESDIESYLEKSDSRSPDMAACLSDLGGPVECSSIPSESYEDEICRNNLIIARARLIDWIWAHKPVEELDEAVVINKMIARIYNGDKSMDEFGTEMFNLSDRFVKINKDNTEAHNLRSYFSIQAIKLKFDPSILEKGKVSANFLAHSPNSDSSKAGLLYSSAYSLIEYVSSQNITDLEQAEVHAKDYIATYPDLPAGYHMMAMIEGYRGNLSLCKEWTQKGLKVGGSGQVGYNDYREIVKSIENGTFRKESLGIRIDPSEAFNPEKILQ